MLRPPYTLSTAGGLPHAGLLSFWGSDCLEGNFKIMIIIIVWSQLIQLLRCIVSVIKNFEAENIRAIAMVVGCYTGLGP
jgi:hypothetical protein